MSEHGEIRKLLPLAAAGALSAEEQRRVDSHTATCGLCAAELSGWQTLTETLEDAPTPAVPDGLLERTRDRVLMVKAVAREQRWSDAILAVLVLFGWTMTFVVWVFWRLMTGELVLDMTVRSATIWIGGVTSLAWLTAGTAVVLMASKRAVMRRYL